MKPSHKFLLSIIIGITLVIAFYLITGAITSLTGFVISENINKKDNQLTKCLSETDLRVYMNSNNLLQDLKKLQVYEYLNYVDIMNCNINQEFCTNLNIDHYPSWNVNGKSIKGDVSFNKLLELSGCNQF